MELGKLKQSFPNIHIVGFTASATATVLDDIASILKLEDPVLFRNSINRPTLYYEVRRKKPTGKQTVFKQVANQIKGILQEYKFTRESGIVYCPKKYELH